MNSLRARLVLGIALVAIVPLGIGMFVMSQRFERTVRDQAAARLEAALGALNAQLAADGARIGGQLTILGRDPSLKRLVLLRPAGERDLPELLERERFLLDLDFLSVTDTAGTLIADAAAASAEPRADAEAWRVFVSRPALPDTVTVDVLQHSSGMVLDARAPIPYEDVRAGTIAGGRALDATLLARLARSSGVELVLHEATGEVVASTIGDSAAVPADTSAVVRRIMLDGRSFLRRDLSLGSGAAPHATITGLVPTAGADATIAALRTTALLLGLLGVVIAIVLGTLWSSQVSRPVERLAAYSDRLARGEWDEPLELESVRELDTLVASLESLRTDLSGYRDRLVVSERHAAWSLMARKVAHEVKNPLTPIAISIADLRRSYELQRPEFPQVLEQATRTISEEVESLKRLLNEFSEFARLPAPRIEPCAAADLLRGIEALYASEAAAQRLSVTADMPSLTIAADPGQLRQVLINLVKNGLEAAGVTGRVQVSARRDGDDAWIAISDTGPGMTPEQRANLFVPGFSTKASGSGLGLTIVERIVSDHHGTITVESVPGRGTTFHIRLPLAHAARTAITGDGNTGPGS